MRAIDADEVVKSINNIKIIYSILNLDDFIPILNSLIDLISAIDTVDAIPMKWLCQYNDEYDGMISTERLIKDWKMIQAKDNGRINECHK